MLIKWALTICAYVKFFQVIRRRLEINIIQQKDISIDKSMSSIVQIKIVEE